jgi:hypothetical protein
MRAIKRRNEAIGGMVAMIWVGITATSLALIWRVAEVLTWYWIIVALPGWTLAVTFSGAVIALKVGSMIETAVESRRTAEDRRRFHASHPFGRYLRPVARNF